jgi:hypothetical protein
LSLVTLWGCGDADSVNQTNSEEYFPLRTGFYQIYAVQETIYTELTPPEEFVYELKTEVVDSFVNMEGRFTYVIHRSKRQTDTDPWVFEEAWSARVNTQQVVSIEGNVSFIRIAIPAFKNKEWNGNALNSQDEDIYLIESAGVSYALNAELEFDDALVINQENEINNLFRDEREEVYARYVGLIYKKSVVLNYCDEVPCFGQQIISDGVEYFQVLKEYGQN